MNKNTHRLVYSRLRGIVVAVAETAIAEGKSATAEARARRRSSISGVHVVAAGVAALGMFPTLSDAQIVPTPGTSTHVIQTPNGLPQVNVARPSNAGVSVNTYNQFDVQKAGAILNNSATMVQTQQAGWINGNPNYGAGQAARIIVNQVNSPNPSQIRGALEIAGSRAELVLANPSGIYLDGASFINTSRATLTTGVPYYGADGSLAGYNVNRGLVTVSGAGLNATGTDQVDLIARAVQVNAAVYAKNMNVIAGTNQVNHDTLAATPIAGDGPAPSVAIDVSQLGGMYSNRIFLASNEFGVGVANAGTIAAQAGDLTLQSNGRLVLTGKTTASGNLALSATGGIQNSGTTYAQQSASVNTAGDLKNSGTLAARQNTIVNAGTVNSTGTLGAGVNNDGSVGRGGDLNVSTSGQLSATGQNVAGGNASLSGSSVNLAGSQTAANGNLSLNARAGDMNLSNATTSAQGDVHANASGTMINDHGNLSSGGSTTLTGGALSNQSGKVSSQSALSVNVAGQIANQSGELVSESTADLRGGDIANNQGTIQSAAGMTVAGASLDNTAGRITSLNADGLSVTTSGQLINAAGTTANGAQGGVIGGNGDVSVGGANVVNRSTITSNTNLRIAGQSVDNGGGTLQAAQKIAVDAGARLINNGGSIVGQTATVSATTLDNSAGTVQADQMSLTATDLVNHSGTITQTGAGAMNVNVSGTLDNSNGGTLQTNSTDLTLAPAALVNDGGTITHAGTGTLTLGNGSGSVSNVGGAIASNGRVVAQAGTLNNTSGSINAQNGLAATVAGTLNNASGKLLSNMDLGVTSGTLSNDGGQIGAGTNATLRTSSMTNQGGSIVAPNLSVIADSTLDNSGGKLEANQLALTAANLVNHGGTITQYGPSAMGMNVSGTLDNSAAGVIQTNATDLTLEPAELNNAGGTITHAGTGTLTIAPGNGARALNNASGTIVTKGQAIVNAASWNNASGILAAQRGINATIAGDVNNAQGLLQSDASLSLKNGGALSNRGGHIQAGQSTPSDTSTLAIQSASIDNADGAIVDLGVGKMTVQGGSQIANSHAGGVSGMGAITGNGDVTVSAASISNTQGGQLSGASLHVQGNTLDNSGGTIGNVTNSNGDVDVTTTGAITNTNGQISSTHDLSVSAATLLGGGTYSATHDANVNLQGDYTAASDTQFNVGHDLAFTLPGTFTNIANLQSVNNLSVNAGNIVNVGALTAGGLLHTQSINLTNTGALVGASASLNAVNTISNLGPTALIGASDSNGTLEILARDIENRDDTTATDSMATTAIFGMGKVVLGGGKDASGNYTNAGLVNNVSALIQSGSDMKLHADKVTSTRRVMKTSTSQIDPALLAQFGISMSGCVAVHMEACAGRDVGGVDLRDPAVRELFLDFVGGVPTDPPHSGQWNSNYQKTTYYADSATATTVTDISPAAQIVSGGKIDASSVGTLQNYWSNIAAVGDIKVPGHYDADGWAATGQKLPGVTVSYSGQYHYNNYDNTEHDWQLPFGNAPFVTGRPGGYTQAAPASIKDYTLPGYFSTLSSNGTISGTGVSVSNTAANTSIPSLGLLPGQSVPGLTPTNLSGNASGAKSGASSVHGGPPAPVDPIIASATALNVLNNLTIPQGGLFKPTTAPNASYVIETNPAFTNQKNFISSDYFFGQLGVDLTHIPKRLGDGFYEQQLVRNQVTALTGKAVLGPYADLQTMYQSLMTAGADLSRSLDLPMGASLSAEQVSKLTGNVIMMEARVVDGQSVLVPVVYLAQANQQNINGPLISATNIDFQNAQSFTNSGTIKADNTLEIQGKQIDSAFGALQSGGLMSLKTDNNIDLTSANVKAGSLQLDAGKNLVLDTATKTNTRVSRDGATSVVTTLGPTAKLDVAGNASITTGGNFQQNAGNLSVGGNLGMNVGGNWDLGAVQTGEHKIVQRANGVSNTDINKVTGSTVQVGGASLIGVGGDLTAKGAQIDLGQGGAIAAKGNVTLGAASATSTVNSNSSGRDRHGSSADTLHTSDQALTGTTLKGSDTVTIASGKDLTISGSTVSLDKGNANLMAAGDVNIGAATETHELNSHETHSHSNVVSGVKVASGIDQTMTLNQGSLVSADGANIVSGKDVNVQGSTIVGTNDVTLTAARNVTVTTSQDTLQSSSYYNKKESGLMSGGGLSVSVGSSSLKTTNQSAEVSNNASTIGSLNGNLSIAAGNDLHVTGSDLIAAKNLSGTGANVTIDAAQDKNHRGETQEVSKSGLTLALKAPVIDAVSNAVGQSRASSNSQDGRAAALHGMAAASAAWDANMAAGDVVRALGAGETPQFKVEVSVGSSHSKSAFSEDSLTNRGSNVNAGGTVAFAATGNGQAGSGNVTIAGSNVNANDVILAAKNQVNIVNTTDTDSTRSTNDSKSASVGVSVGTGGFGISAAMSKANGDGNSDLATQNNSHVNAANGVTIISGGDTNIIGSNVNGNQVNADVGGNLNIVSVQDTLSSAAHQSSSGGGFSISQGGASASFSQSKGNASGSYAGVNEQAGIQAGDGGFNINVTGNTDLKGGLIASSADAAKNSLTTGSLSFSDIQNQSHYDASSSGFSAGATTGDGGMNYSTHGSASGKNAGGAAPMLGQNDSGSDSATTKSGVSAGTITITDSANQKQDVASLNRDTADTNGTVAKLPDMQNLLANQADMMAAASAAGEAVSRRIGDYADKMMKDAAANGDQAGVDAWKEGGANRALMQGAGAALVTGLAGGNAVGGAAGAAIASIASGKLNELSSAIAGSDPTGNANMNQALGNIVANALATGAGAAVGGEAGAFSGYNVDRFNRQLHPDERQWAKDKAKDFAKFYEEKTGKALTVEQARNMLLANGYRLVDAAASKGPGGDATAVAYISQNGGGLFHATPAEYNSPFLSGNKDGSLTPEQKALPGAVANPKAGLVIAGGLVTAGLAPEIAAGLAAIPGAPIFGSTGALGSSAWTSPVGIGVLTGGVNATSQYIQNGTVNPVDVGYAAMAGGAGTYTKFFGNVVINSVTGALDTVTNNAISGKHDSIATGAAVNAGAAAIGYVTGLAMQNLISALAKSGMGSFGWSGTGVWSGSSGQNLFNPNNVPAIGAGIGGAAGAEAGTKAINDAKSRIGK
ncbi:hemagglutinin repeat-containing protein [Burkholderia sp. BCCIQ04A]|uniref:Hemagglutinin repeat-containing protein n=1 Tax=Burkholderia anthinoferrum TaxID=3090833 RepID=A0ABU5WNA1_9BURK|nr:MULTISPECIES: hemagglutinin repeat-containing protein [Burkholderia]MEB2505522.1 hemagglutinin repeat-containing protein [Burkholderia anthinoferrum]MEB2531322.1 hemagglutinin repeat-containing protein [Burkholderia anthinoferrum]MEB2560746.1 hemagglutinin repeat-containing protein [Burkholderia anthinoferrum]MEB2580266.1 hemagglutinin repeat-containing protein [Burkholderia anthinoferrum]MCA8104322.1 hemagglutinin repeat-containing protein [Burkholderia sp. AU36459]